MSRPADNNQQPPDALTERLLLYLEGQMDPAGRAAIEHRLASEPDLAAELEALRRVDGLLAELREAPPVPADRAERAVWLAAAQIRQAGGRARRLQRLTWFAGVAASLLLAAGAGYWARGLMERAAPGPGPARGSHEELLAVGPSELQPRLLAGQLRASKQPAEGAATVAVGARLAWGQEFVAEEPSRIELDGSANLGLGIGTIVRLQQPAAGQLRLEVTGGRWHLAGQKVAGTVVVADGGTVQTISPEAEVVTEPTAEVEGGGAGPAGIALAVFSGVVTLSNPNGQITLAAGEMATATVADRPVKRLWEPSVQAYVDALTQWYQLSPAQQYEVGRLLTELRREQEWLYAPHEQELQELRERMSRFWLAALAEHPSDARQYLEDHTRYRHLLADSPYGLQSILERIEAMLPPAQLSRAWAEPGARDRLAEPLGVSAGVVQYLRSRYDLSDEQLAGLEQYLRANRLPGQAVQNSFDDLLAAINVVVPPAQIRRADERAARSYRQGVQRREALLTQVLPELDWSQPTQWHDRVVQFAQRCRLTFAQVDHARQVADEMIALAEGYSRARADELAELEAGIAKEADPGAKQQLVARRHELSGPLRAWAQRLRDKLAELPTLEQLELATQPTGMDEF